MDYKFGGWDSNSGRSKIFLLRRFQTGSEALLPIQWIPEDVFLKW
jgi:hypothetical protein